MPFRVETLPSESYAREAAERIAAGISARGSLVLTGGTTAERVYPSLARSGVEWSGVDVFFSDERCVPPDDPGSNYGMAQRLLIAPAGVRRVHRMRGEDPPDRAAEAYDDEIVASGLAGFDLVVLGMGVDNHIAAMFPGSAAVRERSRLCVAVDRPDRMKGLTLTPPAITSADSVLLLVAGSAKAPAVARALEGTADVESCPVLLLADHPDVTFLLDDEASSHT